MITLIEDTRQKASKHKAKHEYFSESSVPLIRCALPFGDYAAAPEIAVDTKQNIEEMALNLCGSFANKTRLRNECVAAKDAGCKLIFLIEDSRYSDIPDLYGHPISIHNGMTISGDQLATAMHVMSQRYGCGFMFCRPEDAGRIIMELLDHERKLDKTT